MSESEYIEHFLEYTLEMTGQKGYVVGISGGVDSSVVYALCVRAVGKDKVIAVTINSEFTTEQDITDAHELIHKFDTSWNDIEDFDLMLHLMRNLLPDGDDLSYGNMMARLRMIILYFYANEMGYLVCGTTDRTEEFIGYVTKYGDGGVDLEPIIHLTKTQVRKLARELELPESIITKPSSPRLWADHEAEKELGFSYEDLDKILMLHDKTAHKRRQIPHISG